MSSLHFALVGCGRIARKHAELLAEGKIKGARLVAVCDTQKDRAKYYGGKYQLPWFIDMHEMMQSMGEQIDVVNILTAKW